MPEDRQARAARISRLYDKLEWQEIQASYWEEVGDYATSYEQEDFARSKARYHWGQMDELYYQIALEERA